ncbi:hypothetical protein AB1K62_05145 [Parasphingorhabdus sp. JC815]|uniref:hypothetical protein n=1 Tax=Parasphingorhabdus sp. JC815 TaxID=3232140 RepID=UPI00345A8392
MIKCTNLSFIGTVTLALILQTPPAIAQVNSPDEDLEAIQPDAQTSGSGNESSGIFQLNQSAADLTQQDNIFAASVVTNNGAALSDATSSQRATDNSHSNASINASAVMADVGNASSGVTAVNQSSATGSSQANIAALAIVRERDNLAVASATGSAMVSQTNPATFDNILATSTITNVGNNSSGIFALNQVSGNGGIQENIIAVAAAPSGVALADVVGSSDNGDISSQNEVYAANAGPVSLMDSFNNMGGLAQVNQASGGGNLQSNLLAIALGDYADAQAISDNGLGTVHPAPTSLEENNSDNNGSTTLAGSFDGFAGIAQVSQVSGHANQTTNSMSISMTHIPGGGL